MFVFTVFIRQPAPAEINVTAGYSVVLNCPFYSVPKANVTWTHADGSEINYRTNDRRVISSIANEIQSAMFGICIICCNFIFRFQNICRYFQLLNGSLLITNANPAADNKKFKCTAINGFSAKPRRMYQPFLHVKHNIDAIETQQPKLMPPLQNKTVTIGSGQTLRLLCATTSNVKVAAIEWHFMPRSTRTTASSATSPNAPSTIPLNPLNLIEMKIENVTPEANDGIYNCSYAGEFQVSFSANFFFNFI